MNGSPCLIMQVWVTLIDQSLLVYFFLLSLNIFQHVAGWRCVAFLCLLYRDYSGFFSSELTDLVFSNQSSLLFWCPPYCACPTLSFALTTKHNPLSPTKCNPCRITTQLISPLKLFICFYSIKNTNFIHLTTFWGPEKDVYTAFASGKQH